MLNKAKPEGSIVERYLVEESINFCAMYMDETDNRFNQLQRNYDGGTMRTMKIVFPYLIFQEGLSSTLNINQSLKLIGV